MASPGLGGHLKYPSFSRIHVFPRNFRTYNFCSNGGHRFCFTVSCKLETSEDERQSNKKRKEKANFGAPKPKIMVPDSNGAPPISEDGAKVEDKPQQRQSKKAVRSGFLKKFSKRVLAILSNLPLALAEMFAVAALMALGTNSSLSPFFGSLCLFTPVYE